MRLFLNPLDPKMASHAAIASNFREHINNNGEQFKSD